MQRYHWIVMALVPAVFLGACARYAPYYPNTDSVRETTFVPGTEQPATKEAATASVEEVAYKGQTFSMAFVEFGEQGSYQEPRQIQKARDIIHLTPRPLVVTYLHGWHNNAAPDCNDVHRFRQLLAGLSQSPDVITSHFHVIGVYLGWRGESSPIPLVNIGTFWSRKTAAERLASNYDCIDSVVQIANEARAKGPEKNYTILLGHSFGGLVVERAVAHSIVTEIDSQSAARSLPADLIITLNPASDSILSREMISSLDNRMEYQEKSNAYVGRTDPGYKFPGNRQVIVALSAENDRATGFTFPLGAGLSGISKVWTKVFVPGTPVDCDTYVPYQGRNFYYRKEGYYYTRTPGNNPDLISDRIVWVSKEQPPHLSGDEDAIHYNLRTSHADKNFYTSSAKNVTTSNGEKNWNRWSIIPARPGAPKTPYRVYHVPPDIIDDHGGIWSENNIALMAAIFRMNYPLAAKPQVSRETNSAAEFTPIPIPGPHVRSAPAPFRLPKPDPARLPTLVQ